MPQARHPISTFRACSMAPERGLIDGLLSPVLSTSTRLVSLLPPGEGGRRPDVGLHFCWTRNFPSSAAARHLLPLEKGKNVTLVSDAGVSNRRLHRTRFAAIRLWYDDSLCSKAGPRKPGVRRIAADNRL